MKITGLILFSFLFFLLTNLQADNLGCPKSMSADDVTAWRDGIVDKLAINELGTFIPTYNLKTILQQEAECFENKPPICLDRLFGYANFSSLGYFNFRPWVPNFESDPSQQPPKEWLVPGTKDKYTVPKDIEKIAEKNGWPTARYKSRHSGGFDSESASLLMVVIPGDKLTPPVEYDRYINIPLTPDPKFIDRLKSTPMGKPGGKKSDLYTFTMVTINKSPDGIEKPKILMRQFGRNNNTDQFSPNEIEPINSCIQCHPSGLRQISPLGYHVRKNEMQMSKKNWFKVKAVNEMMEKSTGGMIPDWQVAYPNPDRKFKSEDIGPVYGPETPLTTDPDTRSKEFILGTKEKAGCAFSRDEVDVTDIMDRKPGSKNIYKMKSKDIRWQKIKTAMSCQGCHDGNTRGVLNYSTDSDLIDYKILVDQSMPMYSHFNRFDLKKSGLAKVKDNLTADERIALANCLKAQFSLEVKQVKKWLKEKRCDEIIPVKKNDAIPPSSIQEDQIQKKVEKESPTSTSINNDGVPQNR